MQVKHKKNISFAEARKIVGSYMEESTYASVVRKKYHIRQSNQEGKYIALMERLIQLEPKDWPKFQAQLKKPAFGWSSNTTKNI